MTPKIIIFPLLISLAPFLGAKNNTVRKQKEAPKIQKGRLFGLKREKKKIIFFSLWFGQSLATIFFFSALRWHRSKKHTPILVKEEVCPEREKFFRENLSLRGHIDSFRKGYVNSDSRILLGDTPLFSAIRLGYFEFVEEFLDRPDVDPNAKNWIGDTPLILAAKIGNEWAADILLSHSKIKKNTKSFDGKTPLIWGSRNGHKKVVRLFLSRGDIDPNRRDENGYTALMYAIFRNSAGMVDILLADPRIDVGASHPVWGTTLDFARQYAQEGIIEAIRRHPTNNQD